MIKIYFDGFCDPEPKGRVGIGAIIERNGKILTRISDCIGSGEGIIETVAEYEALIRALDYLKANDLNREPLIIYSDNTTVIKQMQEEWSIKTGTHKDKAIEALRELRSFKNTTFQLITRAENVAEELSRKAVLKNNI